MRTPSKALRDWARMWRRAYGDVSGPVTDAGPWPAAPASAGGQAVPGGQDWSRHVMGAAASREDSISGLRPDFRERLLAFLRTADVELGPGLQVFSGYRSVQRQSQLWEEAVARYGSEEEARRWVARPGESQHNHGNAADLAWRRRRLDSAPTQVRAWAHSSAGRFGLAFPMEWEPWHIEAVRGSGSGRAPSAEAGPPQAAGGVGAASEVSAISAKA